MKIKITKNTKFCIFCTCLISFLLYTSIILDVDNGHQRAFSQGYIPPPISNIQSTPINCPDVRSPGPTYVGPDGCTRSCPNNTNNPNVITAQVFIPECQQQKIGNQSG
jgi:hypothetical protein